MKLRDAIIEVLRKAGEPLHYKEITQKVLVAGLWETTGTTPASTVRARISEDIKKNKNNSPFVPHGMGKFSVKDRSASTAGRSVSQVQTSSRSARHGSLVDIAARVLESSGSPMHCRDIVRKGKVMGWIVTAAKAPERTLLAAVRRDVKRQQDRDEVSRFTLQGGMVGLTAQDSQGVHAVTVVAGQRYGPLSFADSAAKVLEEFGNRQPMHYADIAKKAVEQGWLVSRAKNPEASMSARIGSEIRRQRKRGETPRFVCPRRGMIGLSKWQSSGFAGEINRHNKKVRQNLLQELRSMSWQEFEDLVAEKILEALGFKRESIEVTPYQKDGGIDARGILEACDGVVEIKMAVQVKKRKSNQKIQAPDVQKLRGALATGERGMIITTSDFTSGAKEEAVRESATPIALMTGEALVSHLIVNEIGVKKHSLEDWIELNKEGLRLKAGLEVDTDE